MMVDTRHLMISLMHVAKMVSLCLIAFRLRARRVHVCNLPNSGWVGHLCLCNFGVS